MSDDKYHTMHRPSCPQCGKPTRTGDKFCRHCGFLLDGPPLQSRNIKRRWPKIAGALLGIAIVVVGLTHLGTRSSTPHSGTQALAPSSAPTTATPSASSSPSTSLSPSSSRPSLSTHPTTLRTGWQSKNEPYHGAAVSIVVPTSFSHYRHPTSTKWVWEASSYSVILSVTSHKASAASTALGPNVFGTPITHDATAAMQTIYLDWPQRGWVRVAMKVPRAQESWIATIARSVQIH